MTAVVIAYVTVMSTCLFIAMGYDKTQAKKGKWRMEEATLHILAFCGGAIGGVLAMYLFRHKTRKNAFAFGFPLLAAIQTFIIVTLL